MHQVVSLGRRVLRRRPLRDPENETVAGSEHLEEHRLGEKAEQRLYLNEAGVNSCVGEQD